MLFYTPEDGLSLTFSRQAGATPQLTADLTAALPQPAYLPATETDAGEASPARRDFGAAMGASLEELTSVRAEDTKGRTKTVGVETALDLMALHELSRRVAGEVAAPRKVISSFTALMDYVRVTLQHQAREQFRVLFLDRKNQLIADELMGQGTIDHAPAYPREVVKRALDLHASAIILVHNHPSGDPTPSQADIDMTRQIMDAGRHLKIEVHDHLIVGRQGVAGSREDRRVVSLKAIGAI